MHQSEQRDRRKGILSPSLDYDRIPHLSDGRDERGCSVSTPPLAFPASFAEKYRPVTIAGFIGLEKAKKIMGKFAAHPYQSAWLFVGPPGVGKTSMAQTLASEIGAEVHHVPSQKCNAQAIEDVCRMCAYVPLSGGFHLVIVDEA